MAVKYFDLQPEMDALEKKFPDATILQGLAINESENDPMITLMITGIVPTSETLEGGNGPYHLSLRVSITDPLKENDEKGFINKYFHPIRNILQNHEWVLLNATPYSELNDTIVLEMAMNFKKVA